MRSTRNSIETTSRKDCSEIRLNSARLGCLVCLLWLLFLIGSSFLYAYLWMEISVYWVAYYMAKIWAFLFLKNFPVLFIAYQLFRFLVLYLGNGRKWTRIGWHFRWRNIGPYSKIPITLGHYRLYLLLPPLLLGILPAMHGFCTGNEYFYAFGLLGTLFGIGSFQFWLKLRRFNDEDLIRMGKKPFEVTIIRRNYEKRQ